MTKDEALDLALEALRKARRKILTTEECHATITAIKQARALDKMAENARELGLDYEPVQEPVAVMELYASGWDLIESVDLDWLHTLPFGTKLYTTPPNVATPLVAQRQSARSAWVGLTDEEVHPLANEHLHYQMEGYEVSGIYNLAQAIEAKLKAKNSL